jgi:hypothetical protein
MAEPKSLSPAARLALAALMIVVGVVAMLSACDLGPIARGKINGPPWIALVAGGLFVLAGSSLALGRGARSRLVSSILTFAMFAGFASLGNWIAFGAGPRACGAHFTGFLFTSSRLAGEIECRAAFGVGAMILNGLLFYLAARFLAKRLPPGRAAAAVEKTGSAVLLVCLVPILLPLLLLGLVQSAVTAVLERIKTGQWPRNEAFITRIKEKMRKMPKAGGDAIKS